MSRSPRFMHVLLEGETEALLFESLFRPYWEGWGWLVSGSMVVTGRSGSDPAFRGGVSRWSKLEREIRLLLRGSHFAVVTTVIDYYGMPADSPGVANRPNCPSRDRVEHVEAAVARYFDDRRFVPHLTLHELETWVFAAGEYLAASVGDPAVHQRLQSEIHMAGGPENINDGRDTAPSKRLLRLCPGYSKTVHGPDAVSALGLPALRKQCPHLDAWLAEVERRATE